MSCGEDHFFGRTTDPEMFIHCIGTHVFRFKEHVLMDADQTRSLVDEQVNREEMEEGYILWYSALDDAQAIFEWLEDGLFCSTEFYHLEFKDGGYVEFLTGEFHFVAPPGYSAKDAAIKILESYGYNGAEEIWRLMRFNDGLMVSLSSDLFLRSMSEVQGTIDHMIAEDTVRKENREMDE